MSLVSVRQLLFEARRRHYEACHFDSRNLESFQAVLEAAEEEHAPIIVGFNGGFLGHSVRHRPESLEYHAGLRLALQKARTAVPFLLNETDDFSQITLEIDLRFNFVIVENEHLELKKYVELAKKVVRLGHDSGYRWKPRSYDSRTLCDIRRRSFQILGMQEFSWKKLALTRLGSRSAMLIS